MSRPMKGLREKAGRIELELGGEESGRDCDVDQFPAKGKFFFENSGHGVELGSII